LYIKWKVEFGVVRNCVNQVLGASVTPLALIPTKGPLWDKYWIADH
jgi:hypothetical protein